LLVVDNSAFSQGFLVYPKVPKREKEGYSLLEWENLETPYEGKE
jgi:hypothetical protein